MSQIQDDLSYLSQTTGARPAGTEEENQAGLYIQRQFEANSKFETTTEEFASVPSPDILPLIYFGASFLFALLAMFVHAFTIPAFIVTLVAAVLYVLELVDIPVLSQVFRRGLTQNIVAKYKPQGPSRRSRKIILVANYDSAKIRPELSPSIMLAVPFLQKASLIALVAMPVIWFIRLVAGVPASSLVWNIITFIALLFIAVTVVVSILHLTSSYNNGANDNASGVAVMMEVARQIANGQIVDKPKPQEDIDGTIIHGEDAARAAGVVPNGAEISYDEPANTEEDQEAQLNAAKAAVANLTGKEVDGIKPGQKMSEFVKPSRRVRSARTNGQTSSDSHETAPSQSNDRPADGQNDASDAARTRVITRPASASRSESPNGSRASQTPSQQGADAKREEENHSTTSASQKQSHRDVSAEDHADSQSQSNDASNEPTPDGMTRTASGEVVPSWFAEAQRKAGNKGKTPISSNRHSNVRRSRYADALEVAERATQSNHSKFVPSASVDHVSKSTHPDASEVLDSKQKAADRRQERHDQDDHAIRADHDKNQQSQENPHQETNEHHGSESTTHTVNVSSQNQRHADDRRAQKANANVNADSDDEPMLSAGEESRRRLEQYGFKPRKRHESVDSQQSTRNRQTQVGHSQTSQPSNVSQRQNPTQANAQQQAQSVPSQSVPRETNEAVQTQQQTNSIHQQGVSRETPSADTHVSQVAGQPQIPLNDEGADGVSESSIPSSSHQFEDYGNGAAQDSNQYEEGESGNRFSSEVSRFTHKVRSSHPFESIKEKFAGMTNRSHHDEEYGAFNDETLNELSGGESGYDSVYHGSDSEITAPNQPVQDSLQNARESGSNTPNTDITAPHDAYTGIPIDQEDAQDRVIPSAANRDATQAMPHIDTSDKVVNFSVENTAQAEARKLQARPSRELHHAPQQTSNRVVYDESNTPVSQQEEEIEHSMQNVSSDVATSRRPQINSNVGKVFPRQAQSEATHGSSITPEQASATVRQIIESTPQPNTPTEQLSRPETTKQRAPIFDMQNSGDTRRASLESGAIPRIDVDSSNGGSAQSSQASSTTSRNNSSDRASRVATMNKANLVNLPTMSGRITNEKSIPNVSQQPSGTPQAPHKPAPAISDVPSISAAPSNSDSVKNISPSSSQAEGHMPTNEKVSLTGSFQSAASTGAFKPITDDLVKGMSASEVYVDDVDDEEVEASSTETGAVAGEGYMNIPKNHRGLFGRLRDRRDKKRAEEEESASSWLDADEDFNPTEVGAERGSWASFQPDASDDSDTDNAPQRRGSHENRQTPSDGKKDDSWNGGAYSEDHARMDDADTTAPSAPLPSYIPQSKGDDNPTGRIPVQNVQQNDENPSAQFRDEALEQDERKLAEDKQRIQETEQQEIYTMRPQLSTEVWFVALGSELSNNSGSLAFLKRHSDELRGSIIVNLEAVGEGELTYIDEEGSLVPVKVSSRMKRLVDKAVQESGVEVARGGKLTWKDSIVSIANKYHVQGMSIVGMDHGKPALMGEAADTEENVSESKLNRAVSFIAGLIRSVV